MYMHWKYNPYHPHIPYSPQVCTNLDLFTPIFNIIKMIYETFQLSHCLHFHAESGQIPILSHIHCQFLHAFCKVWSSGLSFKIRSHWYSSRSSISNCSSNSHFVVCFHWLNWWSRHIQCRIEEFFGHTVLLKISIS